MKDRKRGRMILTLFTLVVPFIHPTHACLPAGVIKFVAITITTIFVLCAIVSFWVKYVLRTITFFFSETPLRPGLSDCNRVACTMVARQPNDLLRCWIYTSRLRLLIFRTHSVRDRTFRKQFVNNPLPTGA